LPQDYAGVPRDVPRLGPALPADIGRIVSAGTQPETVGPDVEQQRAAQETEAALTSKVFASTTSNAPQRAVSQEAATAASVSSDESFAQSGQDRKLLFVNSPVDRRTTAPDRISRPGSPFVLQLGESFRPR
jgi:type IV secretory pathway VirB10-like protein